MKLLPGILGGILVWCLVSAQQPIAATEGYSAAVSGINWVKVLSALVPVVISLLQGGKFDWKSILGLFVKLADDKKTDDVTPKPGPSPEPRPVLDLFRRLVDALVADGKSSLAKDVIDLLETHAKESKA